MTVAAEPWRPVVLARIVRNWAVVAGRIRRVRLERLRLDWRNVASLSATGLALVALSAILDPQVIDLPERVGERLGSFFQWATRFGKTDWLLIPTAIVVVLVALGDWRRVSRVHAGAWAEIAAFVAVFFVIVAGSGLFTDLIKALVGRWRPDFAGADVYVFSPLSFAGYKHYSFPSGHATTAGAVAVVIMVCTAGGWRLALLAAAAVIAISRIMIGVHYPSDVAGGVLVGAGIAWLILRAAAVAGLGFTVGRRGRIRPHLPILAQLRRRKGLALLPPSLWIALAPDRR